MMNLICNITKLQSIKNEWDEIYSNCSVRSPFLSFEFINLWYNCFSKPEEVRVYQLTDGERTIGFLPLVLKKENSLRILKSLTNAHCMHSGPLVHIKYNAVFPEMMLKEIYHDRKNWDLLNYRFSYSFSVFPGLFSDEVLNGYRVPWHKRIEPTYTILLYNNFNDYFQHVLSSNTRNNYNRHKNLLMRAGSFRFLHYNGFEALEHWPEFVRIEDSGWKGTARTSIKTLDNSFQKYYKGLLDILAKRNSLNIYLLEFEGKAIAGEFGYIEGDTYHSWKTGYDEKFSEFSPFTLLFLYIIEYLINNIPEVKKLHMFPWDHNYKHRYINTETTCLETMLINKTLRGKVAGRIFYCRETLRKLWIKSRVRR